MKLKGIKVYEVKGDGSVYIYTGQIKVYKESQSIYADNYYHINEEVLDIKNQPPGYYDCVDQPIDLSKWIDPEEWIPSNIHPKFVTLRMWEDGEWMLYDADGLSWNLSCLIETYPDPLGPKWALFHRDEDGNWNRTEEEVE